VPEISRFFGVTIRMYFNDHNPPHFHALYEEWEGLVAIESLEVLRGYLPRRALALVLEWAVLHRGELRAEWALAREARPLFAIAPLD
jgi:hypothetical protein